MNKIQLLSGKFFISTIDQMSMCVAKDVTFGDASTQGTTLLLCFTVTSLISVIFTHSRPVFLALKTYCALWLVTTW